MKHASDQELLTQVRQANSQAFDELYQRCWKPLYVHAFKKTGDKDEAFDLVQDVFVTFWDKRKQLPEITTSPQFYLRGMLIHKIARYFRDRGFKEAHEKNFAAFLRQEGIADREVPALNNPHLDIEETVAAVHSSIESMPQRMRKIFQLNKFDHLSIAEIAEALNLSPQTVKNQLGTAISRIKKEVTLHHFTPEQLLLVYWLIKP
ncbi:RNA polymerase sigma factor [Parapedobacter koreensis]|uniref:RNA polymerase sigma-70 factor, ECF subfamily n=1 Tax=Parapedobacter koreensis TaxID=332977 RepID=A0A1H7FLI6_9SPHI|nr:sigma-70 family RNA polymerase sigma factor [Parapedobacter koreensis]SEK26664.1 RNA polymerase sigma-70 factor, ECF subfamily [Parapedobacter koreensis]